MLVSAPFYLPIAAKWLASGTDDYDDGGGDKSGVLSQRLFIRLTRGIGYYRSVGKLLCKC